MAGALVESNEFILNVCPTTCGSMLLIEPPNFKTSYTYDIDGAQPSILINPLSLYYSYCTTCQPNTFLISSNPTTVIPVTNLAIVTSGTDYQVTVAVSE